MKKIIFLIFLAFFCIGNISSAIRRTLIDFTTFEQNFEKILTKEKEIFEKWVAANPEFNLELYGYHKVDITMNDYKIENWDVILTSSSSREINNFLSYTKAVDSKKFNGKVLGARIHFINGPFLSWAMIKPRFEFFEFYANGRPVSVDDNNVENPANIIAGVLYNVGQIKSISAWCYGLNYKHYYAVRLRDREKKVNEYPLGNGYYDGWRNLIWVNSQYTDDIRDRIITKLPLYPVSYPTLTFDSFIVYKPENEKGGDFIVYFKDVVVEYDRAVILEEMDIDDEANWRIIETDRLNKKQMELKTLGEKLYLKKQVERKMKEASK